MNTETTIFITTSFEGFHRWPLAPDEVDFLRVKHRHVFHVRVDLRVSHDDRDVEFILFKRRVDFVIAGVLKNQDTLSWSCETWARELMQLDDRIVSVEVSEDGENGATVRRLP